MIYIDLIWNLDKIISGAKPCYVCYSGTPIFLDLCVETKSLWAYSVIKVLNIFTDMLNITELHPFIHLIKYFVIYHSEKMRYVCYILFFFIFHFSSQVAFFQEK